MLRGDLPHGSSLWAEGPRPVRRHRLDALALNRHQQPQAVIMHRLLSIGMTQLGTQRRDIRRKSRFTPLTRSAVHSGPPIRIKVGPNTHLAVVRYTNT